jgi:tetratricopeptide (TPR) repeat protein
VSRPHRPRRWRALAAASAGLALGACQPQAVKNAAPPIKTISRAPQPKEEQLPIVRSEPVASDPQKALQNYEELLRLNPDAEVRAEAQRRIADLQLQVEDAAGNNAQDRIDKALDIYRQLLRDHPDEPSNDRILYQMARAYQNSGHTDRAIATLAEMEKKYPNSSLLADARFRNAELLYQRGRYPEAEAEYRFVMELGSGAPFYEPAQYKYGWSLFKQQKYEQDIPVFFDILDRELPPGELEDPDAALKTVAPAKSDLAKDSLRVSSLSFTALGGGKGVNEYFSRHGEPRFYPLVYNALGEFLLDKKRYTDAANAYAAFVESHPEHASAPQFQSRVIAAYKEGGFNDLVVREKERYARAYEPSAAYWAGKTPAPEVMSELRQHLEDLGRHYQARAQAETKEAASRAAGQADFITAAGWYRKLLDIYPQDPKRADIDLLYADSLYDGGRTEEAAQQYLKTAYGDGNHPKAPEAAYAAVQAYERLGKEVPADQRPAALRQSVDASRKLADSFPNHPQSAQVLTLAAQNLYEIKSLDEAIEVSNKVLASTNPAATPDQRRIALGVTGDSRFAQNQYPQAEAAYTQVLALTPADAPARKTVVEQLAASIYKQGEAARDKGDLKAAAETFQRVGRVTPDASIRPNADYDAASAYVALLDWPAAETALEGFRARFPQHQLSADVDKKLALAYEKDHHPAQAAEVYQRIAARSTESADTRREAAWLAARLYDEARQPQAAARAYGTYVTAYPQPLDRALDARRRLADIAQTAGDRKTYLHWLNEIVLADSAAGDGRSDASRSMAAQAGLEIGRAAAADARAIPITLPINKSLPVRKQATQTAVDALTRAAGYGFVDTTTAATYELGTVYRDFGRALMDSERPRNLKTNEELEQYSLLLEEQADPFVDQAIKAHEANVQRLKQDLWSEWIRKSVDALGELAPGQYGKREQHEDRYESLR